MSNVGRLGRGDIVVDCIIAVAQATQHPGPAGAWSTACPLAAWRGGEELVVLRVEVGVGGEVGEVPFGSAGAAVRRARLAYRDPVRLCDDGKISRSRNERNEADLRLHSQRRELCPYLCMTGALEMQIEERRRRRDRS